MRRLPAVLLVLVIASVVALGQAPGFRNDERNPQGRAVHPGEDFVGQGIMVENTATVPLTIQSVVVRNRLGLPGSQVARIEVRRRTDGALLGEETRSTALNAFTTDGVRISTPRNNVIGIGRDASVHFDIRIVLRLGAQQGERVRLETNWSYQLERQAEVATGFIPTTERQEFFVAFVSFANDPDVAGQTVYPGQRFLAQRVTVTNTSAVEITLDRLQIRNFAAGQPLGGAFVSSIEVRRAGDGVLLGQQSSVGNFTADAGVPVSPTANHRVPAYDWVQLEVWVTLRSNAPLGHTVHLETRTLYTPRGTPPPPQETSVWIRAGEAQVFTVGGPEGLETVRNETLTGQHVYEGQRFLAQRIFLGDLDPDPYDVTLDSFLVRNTAPAETRLADDRIATIEVARASDGVVLGRTTTLVGFSLGGVRIGATANRTLPDDTSLLIEVWVTLKTPVPDGRQLMLATTVWHSEGDAAFRREFDRTADGNAPTFTTGPERPGGLERADPVPIRERPVYLGEQLVLQGLRLEDNDHDPSNVTINSLVIRNAPPTAPLADHQIARIEIRRAGDNALLGHTTDLRGFGREGVRVLTGSNNVVRDDTVVDLLVLVTIRADAVAGRRIRLETVVWHTEGATTYPTPARAGPEFVTKVNEPPVARFSHTPTRGITWDTTFTFDPRASTDPDGNIALAEFAWDFGDGTPVVTRTGPETVARRYGKGGRFTVRLTVTDEGGLRSTSTATLDVPANRPPTGVDFSFAPAGPRWSDEVTFTPARGMVDPDGDIARAEFEWDFGDGSPTRTVTGLLPVTRLFGKGGEFTVKLTVTDEGGASVTATKNVTVTNRAPTGVDFSWAPTRPKWSDEITFTPAREIADPDGAISQATFEWDFGDGKKETTTGSAPVKYRYGRGGRFTVKLTVTDQGGAKAERSLTLDVTNLPPTGVDFSFAPEKPMWDDEVAFTPTRGIEDPDGDISRAIFRWDFGDGTPIVPTTGPSPVKHTFGKGGTFTVRLTVTDEGAAPVSKEYPLEVTWLTVDFQWAPENPKIGEPTRFTAQVSFPGQVNGTGTLVYAWDFGDEHEQEGAGLAEVTHTYAREGVFTVTLTVTHPNGSGKASHEVTVTAWAVPTITTLTPSPATPEVGQEVTFTATAQAPADDPVTSWEWDFGDGSAVRTTTTGTIRHTFTTSGVFTVRVRARNAQGGWSTWRTLSLYVRPLDGAVIGTRILDNPAATQCRIQVFLPQGATGAKIQIFDMLGRPVLEKDVTGAQFTWDLKDGAGRTIADGLYFYLITATIGGRTERSAVGRILVLR